MLDDISSGENTYLSASVNTAMSYDTTISDEFLNGTVQNIIDISDSTVHHHQSQQGDQPLLQSSGKRTAMDIVDLTKAEDDTEQLDDDKPNTSGTPSDTLQGDAYKKRARKNTPIKQPFERDDKHHMADSDQDSSFLSDLNSTSHTPPQSPFHRRQLWSPIHESPPEYPDDPRHRYHIVMDDVGMPPDSQIDEDTPSKAPHVSPYEVTPGVLADDEFSEVEMQDIIEQQQQPISEVDSPIVVHKHADPHTEMMIKANSPSQGDQNNLVQPKPGEQVAAREHHVR